MPIKPTYEELEQKILELEQAVCDRNDVEKSLRESEKKYRFLFESMIDMVWTLDEDLRTTYVSPSVESVLGFTPEERKRQVLEEMVTPESLQTAQTKLLKELEQDEKGSVDHDRSIIIDTEYYRKDGSTVWMENRVRAIRDSKGEIIGFHGVSRDITDRIQAEKRLKESERRLRNVLETMDLIAVSLDPQGKITFCNDCLLNLTGWRREEVIGKCWFKTFLPPDIRDTIKKTVFQKTISTSNFPAHYTNEILTKDKKRRLINWNNTVFFNSIGDIAGSTSIGEDITDRTLAEKALQKSEKKYRNIYENALEGFFQSIPGGHFISVNPAFARILGYDSPEDLLSNISDIAIQYYVNPEDRNTFQQILRESGKVENFEFKAKRKDGTSIWVSNSTRAYFDEDGEVVMYEGTVSDISERKKVEADRERLTSAVEQMGESVVITDSKGTIEYVNPSFERLTGFSCHEVIGENPRILKSGKHDDEFYRELWETISGGNTWEGKIINRAKEGKLFTEQATISPVFDQDGMIVNYIAVKKDMTEQIRFDEEKNLLQAQLQQSQKVEAIGRLAGGIAHDFNNLLSIILGYGENVLYELHREDPLRQDVNEIIEAGRRSATLTRQLLAFSRRQTLQPVVLNFNDIISSLEKMLGRLIGEDIELQIALFEGLYNVIADPGQIEQVIMNIAVNARDAMPKGGKLIIETANVELDKEYAKGHPSVLPGKYAMFAISDTGLGMDNETLSKIFEPFFTTKDKEKGTGLGLSTVYGIVKQSGGNIWVYSELGLGTTFKIYLPCVETEKEIAKDKTSKRAIKAGSEHILVVEDEQAVRNLVVKALKKHGYKVTAAANGEMCLSLVEQKGLKPDLVITDVVMPGMSGIELIEHLRKSRPNIRELLMSGYTNDALDQHQTIDPDLPIIQKPFNIREIIAKVQEVLI